MSPGPWISLERKCLVSVYFFVKLQIHQTSGCFIWLWIQISTLGCEAFLKWKIPTWDTSECLSKVTFIKHFSEYLPPFCSILKVAN